MSEKKGAAGAQCALAGAVWAVACLSGCMMELDDPQDGDEVSDAGDEIGQETEALTGVNLAGVNLGGANLGGANLSGTNLGGANLGGTNLGGANLGGANLGGANLGGANLGGNNLGGANLGATNLGGANLGGANLGGANLGGANLAGAGLGGSTAAGTYAGLGCPLSGTRNLGTDLTASTSAVDIHGLGPTVANKMLRSGEDAYTRTRSCVVMGIGSTALAKLITQNSSAIMYAALRQLPWGFAQSANGPVALSAWEVVVWGNSRYSVFVMAAPTSATWSGVAGFVKAVWRWAAPPGKTLKIGQIGGGQAVQIYPGMMNAGAHVLANVITEKTYVAGELAFVTATTNNQTVIVDFASWVRMASGSFGLILGNVVGSPPWAEGSIMALDMPDGSVKVFLRRPPKLYPLNALEKLSKAYDDWRNGRRSSKPIPRRCAGWLLLHAKNSAETIPADKCDAYLAPGFNVSGPLDKDLVFGAMTWSAMGGTVKPYNDNMLLDSPIDAVNPQMKVCTAVHPTLVGQCDTNSGPFPVISETYVHLWDRPYDPFP